MAMELTGTINPDVIMPLLLLLSVWKWKRFLVTMKPLQDNKITIDLKDLSSYAETFSVCESPELKLSHNPQAAVETLEKKNAILKIVGETRNARERKKYRFGCLFGFVFFHELREQWRARL